MTLTDTPPVEAPPNPRARLTIIRNTLGEVIPTAPDEFGAPRAGAPAGRLVVAAGQTIASAWGNTTFDQTMEVFANAADRTTQWPAPNEGAQSFLLDSHTPWMFRGGAWHGIPMGFLAQTLGPSVQIDAVATTAIVSVAFPVVTGRRYRVAGFANGAQISAVGSPRSYMGVASGPLAADLAGLLWVTYATSLAASSQLLGQVSHYFTATGTGTATVTLSASDTTGAYRFAPQASQVAAEDIGG